MGLLAVCALAAACGGGDSNDKPASPTGNAGETAMMGGGDSAIGGDGSGNAPGLGGDGMGNMPGLGGDGMGDMPGMGGDGMGNMPGVGGAANEPGSWDDSTWDDALWQ